MTYRIHTADISSPTPLGQGIWLRSQLPTELGDCMSDMCQLDDGLALAYANYRPRHDLLEHSNMERENRSLTVTVALAGESSTLGENGQRFDFIAGHSTMAAFSSVRGERRFPAEREIRQLRLIAQEPLLHRYGLAHLLDGVCNDHSARHIFFGKHGVGTQRLAQSLVHLHGRDAGLLDIQIAALSLLAAQTRTFLPSTPVKGRLRGDDQDRILRVRDILLHQYEQQLTIAYLCTTAGINEFKLKQGFREMFDTSPHRMLMDIRMKKAWELLETGLYVSTVAYRVGYEHLSSFSAAFERYYGRTPKSVAKT
ncbi:AraC family transcriptional regulator [Kerstersia gyiorum]|uniref:helix-turn-helix transcriptional regulator n=1 Tax=Kerstersia gyiorum TaxID=206506 RepID=UPI00215001C4|nr:AraC family transcriptional regulator [Kerstersia gyiorum]MCR4158376.1 AraC family transcriptional regulator [Kerstersia gyiorum]